MYYYVGCKLADPGPGGFRGFVDFLVAALITSGPEVLVLRSFARLDI